jgi:hypothetical protein
MRWTWSCVFAVFGGSGFGRSQWQMQDDVLALTKEMKTDKEAGVACFHVATYRDSPGYSHTVFVGAHRLEKSCLPITSFEAHERLGDTGRPADVVIPLDIHSLGPRWKGHLHCQAGLSGLCDALEISEASVFGVVLPRFLGAPALPPHIHAPRTHNARTRQIQADSLARSLPHSLSLTRSLAHLHHHPCPNQCSSWLGYGPHLSSMPLMKGKECRYRSSQDTDLPHVAASGRLGQTFGA